MVFVLKQPHQKYILDEMIRYFNHPSIGVTRFEKMNNEWKEVIKKIQVGTILHKNDLAVESTVGAWHQEMRDICLLLLRKLNCIVQLKLKKSHIETPLGNPNPVAIRLTGEPSF